MPEQVSLQGEITVSDAGEGQQALMIDTGNGRAYVIILPREAAEKIGKALLAPRVAMPGQNGAC